MVRVKVKLKDGTEMITFYQIFDEALREAILWRNSPATETVKIYHLDGTEIHYLWFDSD